MRPNLSLATIASALTVLGATAAIQACGGEAPKPADAPVNANEVKAAGDKPADGHCGANKDHKAGEASCAAKAATSAAPAASSAAPATSAAPKK